MLKKATFLLISAVTLAGCVSDMYPGKEDLPRVFSERGTVFAEFADLIESESSIDSVWCIPPGRIEAESAESAEPFELTGQAFDAYNPFCVETQAVGAAIHSYGTSIMLVTADSDHRLFRIDLVRLNDSSEREPGCGWLTYLRSESFCDVPLEAEWVARYHWTSSNDIKELYN